jgi:hypothetical protein
MRIAHIFPKHDTNTGDHFVQMGIRQLLQGKLRDFEYVPLSNKRDCPDPSEPLGITRESVALINSCDLLVIGGSNLYEVVNNTWGVVVEPEALEALRVPVLLIGIGSGWSFAYPRFPVLPADAADQIRRLHERAVGSSVRDDLTARVLSRQGIGPVTVTGCPAGFLGREPLKPVGRGIVGVPFVPRRMYSAVSMSPAYRRSATYRRRRLITVFFHGLIAALREESLETRVLVHDAADLPLAEKLFPGGYVYDRDANRMLDAIRECDVIVGFRLHSVIAGLGYGIPAIPVLLDGRNAAFAETHHLLEHAVPIDPDSRALAMERIRMALGPERESWNGAIVRRDELYGVMDAFLDRALPN